MPILNPSTPTIELFPKFEKFSYPIQPKPNLSQLHPRVATPNLIVEAQLQNVEALHMAIASKRPFVPWHPWYSAESLKEFKETAE